MSYPKRIRHKGKVRAVIYRRREGYRVYRRTRGIDNKARSEAKEFVLYAQAKRFPDAKAKELHDQHRGKSSALLSEAEASDAKAALGALYRFFEAGVGKERLTLHEVATRYCQAAGKLGDTLLADAVEGYLGAVAKVKPAYVEDAIEQFIAERAIKTVTQDGKRPPLSPAHHYNTACWLREFGRTFPKPTCVSDLTKTQLNTYMASHSKVGPKAKNKRRGLVKMFLDWAVAHDHLAPTHRLLEASGLKHEHASRTRVGIGQELPIHCFENISFTEYVKGNVRERGTIFFNVERRELTVSLTLFGFSLTVSGGSAVTALIAERRRGRSTVRPRWRWCQ